MDFPQEINFVQKTVFRKGAVYELAAECLELGERGFVVHGKSLNKNNKKNKILSQFASLVTVGSFCRESGEPTLDEITQVIAQAQRIRAQWIAGIGGGSVLDLAKAAAGLFHAKQKPVFYQEGGHLHLEEKGIPFVAVPTTAGTGAEATPNAVIINRGKKRKVSIRDHSFLAR